MNAQKAHMLAVANRTHLLGFPKAAAAMAAFAEEVYPTTIEEWSRERVMLESRALVAGSFNVGRHPWTTELIRRLQK